MSPRMAAAAKIAGAFAGFAVFALLAAALREDGSSPGKLAVVPVLFVAVAWVGLLELLVGAPLKSISTAWNAMPWWKQWPLAMLLVVAFFALWFAFAAIAFSGQP